MRLRKKLLVAAMMIAFSISFVAYAWTIRYEAARAEKNQGTSPCVTKFEAVVNGIRTLDVFVCVNISDGLTEKEGELIVETTFILVMGDYVVHRLDSLTFGDTQIKAHYTWGYDEDDLGHVCDIITDLTTLQITVDHCF